MAISDNDLALFHATSLPQQKAAAKKKKGNLLTNLLPTAGGIGGGAAGGAAGGALAGTAILPGIGTVAGGLIGALVGGAAGGAGGKVLENKLEHNALGDGVKGAAIENGIFSAGPLRLAKMAGTGVKAAAIGKAGLAEALNAGAEKAVAPGVIRTALGNKLNAASENQTVKALGITKGQKNEFLSKTGERMGTVAKKYGITSAEDVPNVVKPMYNEFSNAVSAIPRTFGKQEVDSAFKAVYQPLIADGTPLGSQAIGSKLKEEAANLLKGISKDGITAADLNTKRQAFDKLAYKLKAADPSLADVNKQSRDVISNLIHSAADEHGIKTSAGTLKQLGNQINKVERLGKAAGRNIEGAGGHMQLGLGSLPGATIGAGGGPIGAAAGYAANMALNSGAGRKTTAKLLDKTAAKLTASGEKAISNPVGIKAITKRVAPVGLAGALLQGDGSQADNTSPMTQQMDTSATMPNTSNIDPLSQNIDQNASAPTDTSPFSPANVEANVQKIMANGGKMSDVKEYLGIVGMMQELAPQTKEKPLNSTQLQQANNAQSGVDSLNTIYQTLGSNPNASKLAALPGGSLASALTGTGEYKAALANATDVIGRLRSGGAINADEERRFRSLLPGAFDDQKTVQYKLQSLDSLFQRFINPQGAGVPDQADLVSALGY
jgi:hypothetical protein